MKNIAKLKRVSVVLPVHDELWDDYLGLKISGTLAS